MPVDLYVGGAEHAVLHLLYARFWHKVLYDYGYVSTPEPFQKLVNQGMILGEMEFTGYQDQDEQWVSAGDVKTNAAGQQICKKTSDIVTPRQGWPRRRREEGRFVRPHRRRQDPRR